MKFLSVFIGFMLVSILLGLPYSEDRACRSEVATSGIRSGFCSNYINCCKRRCGGAYQTSCVYDNGFKSGETYCNCGSASAVVPASIDRTCRNEVTTTSGTPTAICNNYVRCCKRRCTGALEFSCYYDRAGFKNGDTYCNCGSASAVVVPASLDSTCRNEVTTTSGTPQIICNNYIRCCRRRCTGIYESHCLYDRSGFRNDQTYCHCDDDDDD